LHARFAGRDAASSPYVSFFVNEADPARAEGAAGALIEQERRDIEELDEDRFEQAKIDGIVATFHRWPVGAWRALLVKGR